MEDTTDSAAPRRVASGVLGPALALPVLAVVVVGAGARRPAWSGDGAWTTPLEILLALLGLVLLMALVVLLRNLPGGMPRAERDAGRRRWWVLAGALGVGALVWLTGVATRQPASEETGGADLGPLGGMPGQGVDPLPTSTTAVVGGLVALGLLAALATLLVRREVPHIPTRHETTTAPAPPDPTGLRDVPDGTPDEVVLAVWAAARSEVVARLRTGQHDPPGRLQRRVAGTAVAAPLRTLTGLYLPVRYGRAAATEREAALARRTLQDLRAGLPTLGGRP